VTETKAGSFDLDVLDVGTGPAVVLLHSSANGHRQWRLHQVSTGGHMAPVSQGDLVNPLIAEILGE
jgi:hypothetical protein